MIYYSSALYKLIGTFACKVLLPQNLQGGVQFPFIAYKYLCAMHFANDIQPQKFEKVKHKQISPIILNGCKIVVNKTLPRSASSIRYVL